MKNPRFPRAELKPRLAAELVDLRPVWTLSGDVGVPEVNDRLVGHRIWNTEPTVPRMALTASTTNVTVAASTRAGR